MHNMQEGLVLILGDWAWFIELLKHVCRLMSNRWSKNRLLRQCFVHLPAALFADEIQAFHHLVYNKRWGTAVAACVGLMPLMHGLRLGWSLQQYGAAASVARDNDDRSANAEVADRAIRSLKF